MMWGCFTWWNLGPLIKIDGIMKKEDYLRLLTTNIPEFVHKCAYPIEEIWLQHENDPKHTAKTVQEWLKQQLFSIFEWPAQSPDLNPTETLWATVKKSLRSYEEPPKDLAELWERIQHTWAGLDRDLKKNIVESMPRRITDVLKSKVSGPNTKK